MCSGIHFHMVTVKGELSVGMGGGGVEGDGGTIQQFFCLICHLV